MPKGIDRTTGEKINYDYTDEGMDEFQAAVDEGSVMPSYDAGGRVERIQGYGKGGEVKRGGQKEDKVTIYHASGKGYKKESPFVKCRRESREEGIKYKAKGIASGKFKNLDITDIVKDVEFKTKEARRSTIKHERKKRK